MLRMMITVCAVLSAVPAMAERRIDALAQALQIRGVVEVMRIEGLEYGQEIATEMFGARGGSAWDQVIDKIYDADHLEEVVLGRLEAELSGTDLAPLEAFFTSDRGRMFTELEISARRAMLDEDLEQAAKDAATLAAEDDTARYQLLERFSDANDLVETNVVGALNASYAFYTGLADGGAFEEQLTQEQIITDVWGQEESIRDETEEWVLSFLGLAYQPLEDADLEAYIVLSGTGAGKALNRALFAAFDEMYVGVSRGLGLGAAQFLSGEDL